MRFCLSLPVILVSFEFIKVSIIGTLWFLLGYCRNVLKIQLSETYEKKFWRPVFLEESQAARNFSKVSLHFNKIPRFLRQVLQTYSEICIFLCATKKSSRSSRQRLILKCQGNLVMKLMTMWWNPYYSKFGSEIWR